MTPQDRGAIEQIRALIEDGNGPAVAAMLQQGLHQPPRLIWDPTPEDLTDDHLRALHSAWHAAKDGARIPQSTDFDLLDLGTEIAYAMLLDIRDCGWDFVYRYYGVAIAERTGFDMTGRSVWEIPTNKDVALFFAAGYRAVAERAVPLFTWHAAPPQMAVVSWDRLILPLAGADRETVDQLLVCNMPGPWRRGQP